MITRHNYEELFLLYVDNELSPADRVAVETFAKENPDLLEELEALQQCKLLPETGLSYGNTASLLSTSAGTPPTDPAWLLMDTAWRLMHPADRESCFLSYVDGELDEDARRSVEALTRDNPFLLRELTLLRQTVNLPDHTIAFGDKTCLFKKERHRRIAFVPLTRIAAAAALLLITGLGIFMLWRKNARSIAAATAAVSSSVLTPIAATSPGSAPNTASTSATSISATAAVSPAAPLPTAAASVTIAAPTGNAPNTSHNISEGNDHPPVTSATPGTLYLSTRTQRQAMAKTYTDGPHGQQANISIPDTLNSGLVGRITRKDLSADPVARIDLPPAGKPGDSAVAGPADGSSLATAALEHDPADDSGNGFSIEQAALGSASGKNKLRGIFRKVSRVFEKTANRDDGDGHGILIGNLQVALK